MKNCPIRIESGKGYYVDFLNLNEIAVQTTPRKPPLRLAAETRDPRGLNVFKVLKVYNVNGPSAASRRRIPLRVFGGCSTEQPYKLTR